MASFPLGKITAQTRTKQRRRFECAMNRTLQELRDIAPFDTGELEQSGAFTRRFNTPSKFGREITFSAEHAVYLDEGTKPHKISVRTARVLANALTGQFFGTEVDHPGSVIHQGWFTDNVGPIFLKHLDTCG